MEFRLQNNPIIENIKEEYIPPEYIKMYEISGCESITGHSLYRYQRDKKQDEQIKEEVENSFDYFCESLETIPEEEAFEKATIRIKKILDSESRKSEQFKALEISLRLPPDRRSFLSGENVDTIIRDGLESSDLSVQEKSASLITCASEKIQALLVERAFEVTSLQAKRIALTFLESSSLSEEIKDTLIQKIVTTIKDDIERFDILQLKNIELIKDLPKDKGESLGILLFEKVRSVMESSDIYAQEKAAELIMYTPCDRDSIRTLFNVKIREALNSSDIMIQKKAAEMVYLMALFAFEDKKPLEKIVSSKISEGFQNQDIEVQKIAAEMLRYSSTEDLLSLINVCFEKSDRSAQEITIRSIMYFPGHDKEVFFELLLSHGFEEEIIKSPLYNKNVIDKEHFSRNIFVKTGSGTTLLGGELKDKTIVRHIEPVAFLTWQAVYENYKEWEKAGFDYVPIEQIQSYKLNKNGLVDVYSGVLDLSLESWEYITEKYKDELDEQRRTIEKILIALGIKHGHAHDGNFCLRFFRKVDGKPDLERIPRVYLIDFDQAISPSK